MAGGGLWKAWGSPAHAGMAPRYTVETGGGARFPRPRGDGPKAAGISVAQERFPRPRGDGPDPKRDAMVTIMVPPPTRGWPPPEGLSTRRPLGSPAHAGMAPRRASPSCDPTRFPRPRGDGPSGRRSRADIYAVPPPTRGWPRDGIGVRVVVNGSPAHAGMAPPSASPTGCTCGFPRPRGDGPTSMGFREAVAAVPPPTRGWPPSRPSPRWPANGSPAHAGMAPGPTMPTAWWLRFPRPRGDGPLKPSRPSWRGSVPPPTRGWPLLTGLDWAAPAGSPAHAGMAPPLPG